MSYNYKKTYTPANGYTAICKIGECSLKKLEFGIIELDAGQKLPFNTEDKEFAFIMLEGQSNVYVNGEYIKGEKIGIKYEWIGDYYFIAGDDKELEDERPIGRWGGECTSIILRKIKKP